MNNTQINNNYLSKEWETAKQYTLRALQCVPLLTALALPIILSTALPTALAEESSSDLVPHTPPSEGIVGFVANAAVGGLSMAFLFGALGVGAHINKQPNFGQA